MKYILFSLLVLFAIPVLASQTEITYDSPYIVATNSPVAEDYDPYSCISYGKWRVHVPQTTKWGNASEIAPNAQNAIVGAFVLTNEGNGHIAYIEALEGDLMLISETNYVPGEYSTRSIPIDDPRIKGYLVLE